MSDASEESPLPEGSDDPSQGGETAPAPSLPPSQPGRISYRLDWNEYWRARELCWRAATGTLFLRLVPATGLVGLLIAVGLVMTGIAPRLAPIFVVFGISFLSTRFFRMRSARRAFRQRASGVEVTIEWDDEGLRTTEGSAEETRLRWEDARIVLLTSAGFLIEPRRGGGTWLPFSGFESPDEVDRFESEVRRRQLPLLDRSTVG